MERTIASALWGTEGFAGLRWVLTAPDPQQLIFHSIAALLDDPTRLKSCHLHRAKFKPGRKLTTFYDLLIDGGPSSPAITRAATVVWRPSQEMKGDEEVARLAAMQEDAAAHGPITPFIQLAGVSAELGIEIQIAPLDEEFPQLVRVSDLGYVQTLVESIYRTRDDGPAPERAASYDVSVIRYRPGQRHVLRYEPGDRRADGCDPRTLFAKLYDDAEETERAFGVASRVAGWLARYGNGLSALRPLGYNAQDAIILYPRLVGVPLSTELGNSLDKVRPYLHHAGSVLRTLHRPPEQIGEELAQITAEKVSLIDDLKPHSFSKEIKSIARTCEHIYSFLPEVGSQINHILQQAQTIYAELPQEDPMFAHGDYKADHLWITDTGLALMDFDTCYLADPAIDIGKFLSDLHWWSIWYDRDDVTALRDAFLSSYAAYTPPARLQRAQVYEALVLVKSTAHRVRLFDDDWISRTEQLIDRATEIITEVVETR